MAFCSIWFRVEFLGLSPCSFGILFHHHFLVPSGSGLGFRTLSPFFSVVSFSGTGRQKCSSLRMNVVETWFVAVWGLCWCNVPSSCVVSIWFQVGFRGFPPYSCGILFDHHFLVSAGSGACPPTLVAFCSVIISWLHLVPGGVPGLVPLVFWHCVPSSFPDSFLFWVGFRGLSPYYCGILFRHHFWGLSPYFSWFNSGSGSGACFRSLSAFCSVIISWFHRVPGIGFRDLSLLSCGILFHHHFLVPPDSGSGCGACLLSLLALCSIIISWFHLVPGTFWFQLGFRSLSPYFSFVSCGRKKVLPFHDFLFLCGFG